MALFSVRSDYALRALTEIAQWQAAGHAEPLSIEQIARRQKIPRKFLEQILATLKRAGLVRSRRGQAGGYLLEIEPGSIRLFDVMRAIESLPHKQPGRGNGDAQTPTTDAVHSAFSEIEDELRRLLQARTIADLMEASRSRRERRMYHI